MSAEFIQHRSPQTNKAKAPYNFVPLPEKVLTVEKEFAAHDKYDSERHTGYIELEIKTETPLYTRCAFPTSVYQNPNNFDDKGKLKVTADINCQQFFHRGNAQIPVIPGSTLRGMTRSLVEILAYGKMNFVSDSKIIHRAVADTSSLGKKYREQMLGKNKDYPRIWLDYPSPNLQGGYLEVDNGEWFIRPAIKHECETFIHVSYDSAKQAFGRDLVSHRTYDCWVIPRKRHTKEKSEKFKLDMATTGQISFAVVEDEANGWRKAKLVVSGFMNNKKMECAIFEPNQAENRIEIKREDRILYQEDQRLSREKKNTPRQLTHNEPVFYLLDDAKKLVFFGSTMMFRLPYTNKIGDFIPETLKSFIDLDLAETIFGTVESPNKRKTFGGRQLSGRVFFTDAICEHNSSFFDNDKQGRFVPNILSSPKPTSFQLYLSQSEPNHYELREAQNGQNNLKAKWYVVTEKALEKMKDDEVPLNLLVKIRKLIGRDFVIDEQSKADEKFLRALESIGVTRDELRNYRKNILNCSAHELRSYYDNHQSNFGTVLRGSKRYWNKKNVQVSDFQAHNVKIRNDNKGVEENRNGQWQNSKQHTIIKPIKPNVKFGNAKVYFENLTSIELGALLTSLDLEETMRHQIGMAKPYGLGSIEIKPTLFLQDRESRYQSLFDENNAWGNPPKTTPEDFKMLFKEKILTHYNDLVSQTSKVTDFWQIPRLQSLATMLEFTNAGNFEQKKYADFQQNREMFIRRHVLPFPQSVENNREPNQIQLNNPNLWAEKCVDKIEGENVNSIDSETPSFVVETSPKIPIELLNLPTKNVPSELNKYYQDWKIVTDEKLKIEIAKVIVEKGNTWKNAKIKTWFQEVVEFVNQNNE